MKVISSEQNQLNLVRLSNDTETFYVDVFPETGALLNAFHIKKEHFSGSIINGYKDPLVAKKTISEAYKGPKLSPFPNRIKDGKFSWEGSNYQLPINASSENHSLHGLLYDKAFELIEEQSSDLESTVLLSHDFKGIDGYPFPYRIQIRYTLSFDQNLSIKTSITNTGDSSLPIGDGWHPYFSTGNKVDSLQLKFPKCTSLLVDDRMIPNGSIETIESFKEYTTIESKTFDTCFKIEEKGIFEIKIHDTNNNITLTSWQEIDETGYGYFQLYTPPHRNSIAIESVSCPANAFNSGEGLLNLASGKTVVYNCGIKVD